MPFTWGDFADIIGVRLRRMGAEDDVLDMLMAGYILLQGIVDTYDLSAYIVQHDALFLTMAGHREYPLPDDFGRLMHVQEEVRSGLPGTGVGGFFVRCSPTDTPRPLRYREALHFRQQAILTASQPQWFTLGRHGGQRALILDPPPDENNGVPYVGEGVYIARVERPDLDDEILLDEPTVLVEGVLAQLAVDKGLPQAPALQAGYQRLMSALVNNAHRKSQQFYTNRWPVHRGAGRQ
jgi:hypothetical protein